MNKILSLTFVLISGILLQAQQVSLNEISRKARFDKQIEELNNGASKINYSDIQGIPYYYPEFIPAKVGETTNIVPMRYNSFLDTVEVVEKEDVYQISKNETSPTFTFETTKEKLVFVKTNDLYSGYFFELTGGKFKILKKVITKYFEAIAAPNPMIAGTAARFDTQKPIYFIQFENTFIKIPKSIKELAGKFPAQVASINDFANKNKIKLNREEDLIKLGNFLNQ